MSLKAFHIFFIAAASTLAVGNGVWALLQHKPIAWAVGSFACSALLDLYLVWFIKKSKEIKPS